MATLSKQEIIAALKTVPLWKRRAQVIYREFEFKDFPVAVRFVNRVAMIAERAWHHPDIDIRWNKVALALTTHDQGGLTAKDFTLATRCDALAAQICGAKKRPAKGR
jgi:4a-hydroxytetrahydrobiopterin dehydratase